MLKTLSTNSVEPRKRIVGVDSDSRARCNRSKVIDNELEHELEHEFEIDDKVGKKDQNPSKSQNLSKSKKIESGFLTSGARMAFSKLR